MMRRMNPTQEQSSSSIHGHDVLDLIHSAQAESAFTPQSLQEEIVRRYGSEARFHTCSAGDMTLEQLLAFLVARNKIVQRQGRLFVQLQNVCNHDHDGAEH